MPATAQNAAWKVDMRQSPYAGRYVLDGILINNGSGSRLEVRDQTGITGTVNAGQPLQAVPKPSGLTFAIVPLDAAGVAADEVMVFLKWRLPREGENAF